MIVGFPLTSGDLWVQHTSVADAQLQMTNQRDVSMTFPDGSFVTLEGVYIDPASGMDMMTSDATIHFADQSLSASALKPIVFGQVTTTGDDAIEGTDTIDTIVLNEGGSDSLFLYAGDDVIEWAAGSFEVGADTGVDTLTIPANIGYVTRAIVGSDYVITANGRTARILFGNILGASSTKGVDRIVFNDMTLEAADMVAWFNGTDF